MEGLYLALILFPLAGAIAVMAADYKASADGGKQIVWQRVRDLLAMTVGVGEFALMCILAYSGMGSGLFVPGICGMGLHFCLDGFRMVYGLVAAFMWMMTLLFSGEYLSHEEHLGRYYFFQLVTLSATLGVFLSADLFTTFIFFEVMSFTSYVWVVQEETKGAIKAAETYLAVAVIGGMVLLMGLFLLYNTLGTLEMSKLLPAAAACEKKDLLFAAGCCTLVGFGAKAGAFPLHIWLPKAHPVAPAPASALLSGILTKAGIFGILVVSCNLFFHDGKWGTLILVIGVVTMVLGAVLALFSVNLKRTLACSSVSQIGFILVGIGMQGLLGGENSLAVRGSLLHMVNHSLFKLVLFMAAGVVYMNIHKLDLNEIRGFGRKKPLLQFIFLMGALGIGGIPLWSGYISKTLLHESIVEYTHALQAGHLQACIFGSGAMKGIEWIFLISGGCTVAYMLKLYVVLFLEKNNDGKVQDAYDAMGGKYMDRVSASALTAGALLFPVMGVLPDILMNRIAKLGEDFMHPGIVEAVRYFSITNLKGALVSVAVGAAIYFILIRKWMMKKEENGTVYVDRWNPYWDLENAVYRPLLLKILPMVFGVACRILDSLLDGIVVLLRKTVYRDSKIPHELEEGNYLTHVAGMGMDNLVRLMNRTVWKKHPHKDDYEHKLAMKHEELAEDGTIIGRSLSFGLLLFCTGLILTLVYLLW